MSSKTRNRVEAQFQAKSFNNFGELEENKARFDMNKLFKNNNTKEKTFYKDKKT